MTDITALRKDLRAWSKDKPQAVSINADHISSNLRILENNPNDQFALAALRKNHAALKAAIASDLCGERQ